MNPPNKCPFCGKRDKLRIVHTEDWHCYVHCAECGADGPSVATYDYAQPNGEAIHRWNTRVPPHKQ